MDEIMPTLSSLVREDVVVTHTHFDRVALSYAAQRYGRDSLCCKWLDSARVARRTWKECERRGYGLSAVCTRIGYSFKHHHALEDAKATGQIILAAMAEANIDFEGILRRVEQPIALLNGASRHDIRRSGNTEGHLFGEVVVFTGALNIPRREAADMAASAGCEVGTSVTKDTTILVVGDTDVQRLAGHAKSAKHRKAEQLIAKGQPIRILTERDFRKMTA